MAGSIEEKVGAVLEIRGTYELRKAPVNSWVNICGRREFKIFNIWSSEVTLYEDESYIYKNYYDSSSHLLKKDHFEGFLKGTWAAEKYLKMIKKGRKN